jgi:hypothetical protein
MMCEIRNQILEVGSDQLTVPQPVLTVLAGLLAIVKRSKVFSHGLGHMRSYAVGADSVRSRLGGPADVWTDPFRNHGRPVEIH